MKRPIAFYPPLIAVYPILVVFAANAAMLPVVDLWRPLGIGLVASFCLWLLVSIPYRSTEKGAFLATVVFALFWLFRPAAVLADYDKFWVVVSATVILVIVSAIFAAKWKLPTSILNFGASLLVAFTAIQTASHLWGVKFASVTTILSDKTKPIDPAMRPDVYYIILDGYGRSDTLKKYLGYDNSAFVKSLEVKGLWVGKETRANYCQTALSLASSMNLEHIQVLFPNVSHLSDVREPLHGLARDAQLFRMFRQAGYMTVAISTGFTGLTSFNVDVNLASPTQYSLLESTILARTPMASAPNFMKTAFDNRRKLLLAAFENLQAQSRGTAKPKFVFAHILAPHPPFVFGPNGEPRRQGGFFYYDGSDYLENLGDSDSYRVGYAGQAEYINKLILVTLDKLLEPNDRPKIIVLQGDHGSKLTLSQNSLEKTDVRECFSTLIAVYGPKNLLTQFSDQESPVNLMRKVVNRALNTKFAPVPNQSFYSPFARPFEFTDVTDRLAKPDESELPPPKS